MNSCTQTSTYSKTKTKLTSKNISSIGWLYAMENRINLTPIFNRANHPVFVNVSKEEFDKTEGDKEKMKALALAVLFGN
jgi:hypothetical protein